MHTVEFVACDCLTDNCSTESSALVRAAPHMDVFTFCYVCVENAEVSENAPRPPLIAPPPLI